MKQNRFLDLNFIFGTHIGGLYSSSYFLQDESDIARMVILNFDYFNSKYEYKIYKKSAKVDNIVQFRIDEGLSKKKKSANNSKYSPGFGISEENYKAYSSRYLPADKTCRMVLDFWCEANAMFFDFLAAIEHDRESKINGSTPIYVFLEKRETSGKIVDRFALYETHSLVSARYFLRQHYLLKDYQRGRKALWSSLSASAQDKDFNVEEKYTSPDRIDIDVETIYPYSRTRRPFSQRFSWYISSYLPEAPTAKTPPQVEEFDERWVFRPGDPKLLREMGTGLYGSYPQFEGDDEPEFRDEL